MLRWFRTHATALAAALLVSLGTLGSSSIVPHEDDCHEGHCVVSVRPHDPSQHSIGGPSSPQDPPFHCVICHLQRLLRPAVEVVQQSAPQVEDDLRVAIAVVSVPPVFPAAQPPLRSPPASPARVA
jgi:hypothetical protein